MIPATTEPNSPCFMTEISPSLRPQPAWEVDAWSCCRCGMTILVGSTEADGWTVHNDGTPYGHRVIFPVCPQCEPELRFRHWTQDAPIQKDDD